MATPQRGLTPEFAAALRETMLQGLANEMQITKKVLVAVPDTALIPKRELLGNSPGISHPPMSKCWMRS